METKQILIVDDEPKVAFFLSKTLERSGGNYQVEAAKTGEKALEVLKSKRVDLLVTDLRMPGISGLELIRWVRSHSPDTRTILITAYGNDEVRSEARRLEAYQYITKPFGIEDFTEAVKGALGQVAVSEKGLTILSDETFERIARQLDELRRMVGARSVFLADNQGQCLVKVGYSEGIDISTLLALLAGGFATSGELARRFGEGESMNLNYHEGSKYEIYSANVGDSLFLSLMYDRTNEQSRIGIVWLYTRRTIKALLDIISSSEAQESMPALDTNFGSSLKQEMDLLFAEPSDSAGPSEEPEVQPGVELRTASEADSEVKPQENLFGGPRPEDAVSRPESTPSKWAQSPGEQDSESRELIDMEQAIEMGLIPSELIGEESED